MKTPAAARSAPFGLLVALFATALPASAAPNANGRPARVVEGSDGGAAPGATPVLGAGGWTELARGATQDALIIESDLAANQLSVEQAVLVQLGRGRGDGPQWMVLQGEDRRWRARRDGCQVRSGLPERVAPRGTRVSPISVGVERSPELLLGERTEGEALAIAHLRPGDTLTRVHVAKKGAPASEHLELVQGDRSLRLTQVGDEAKLCGGAVADRR